MRRLVIVSAAVAVAAALAMQAGAATGLSAGAAIAHKSDNAAISSKRCATNRAAGPITYVSPYGFDASAGIIDVFAAQSLGYFRQMCLTVNFVTNSFASDELVSSGRGTFTSVGSAADTLSIMANGSNMVALATYGDTSDYALLTDPSVTSLKQLDGKTLGYKTTMPIVLTEMLNRAGVNLATVHEVSVSFDPNILPEGKVQALQAYRTNEPLTLSAEHKAYREWLPSSYGVAGTFNVVVVNGTFLANHRQAATDFLRAELHAYHYCTSDAVACVGIEQAAAHATKQTYDYAHSLAEWQLESKLATDNTLAGKGVGVQSLAEWLPEANALVAAKLVKSLPALSQVENTTIAASLYTGKALLWPGS